MYKYPLRVLQNRLGFTPKPSWCTYLVTYRCNAKCSMCDSWKLQKGKVLTLAEVEEVFQKIGQLDVVRLTGGEPFLIGDLPERAEIISRVSNPYYIHITSNGSYPELLESLILGFSRPEKLRIMISIDGLEESHNLNRGKAATFKKALAAVEKVVRLRHLGVDVSINMTLINSKSLEEHKELEKIAKRMNVELQAVLAYNQSAMYSNDLQGEIAEDLLSTTDYPLHDALDREECLDFALEQVSKHKRQRSAMSYAKFYYWSGMVERLKGESNPSPNPKCVALRSHIRLLPDGSVPVCQFNTKKVGNLVTQSFEEVWHDGVANSERAWVDNCKGCWAECEVMPNALFSGDMLKPGNFLRYLR